MVRNNNRKANQLRKIKVKKGFLKFADGSCLIEWGNTKVLCTAALEEKVPGFLRNTKRGWLTAEYGMLPASCQSRIAREGSRGKVSGRTHEIQRFIGRSLRSIVNFEALGERTIWIDCDVIQGDGGTRTASITGAFIALGHLVENRLRKGTLKKNIIKDYVAAVSIGILQKRVLLDLNYIEDSNADVDMNVVMTGAGELVEIQGTAEGRTFSFAELQKLMSVAKSGIFQLIKLQKKHVSV